MRAASAAVSAARCAELPAAPFQLLDFGLAREDAGVRRIGRVKAHRVAGELVAFAIDQQRAGRQGGALRGCRNALRGVDAGEPVGERAGDPCVHDLHLVLQGREPRHGIARPPPCRKRTGSLSPAGGPAPARCCHRVPARAAAPATPTPPRFPSRARCVSFARSAAARPADGAPARHAAAHPLPPRPAPASRSRAGRPPPCSPGSLRRRHRRQRRSRCRGPPPRPAVRPAPPAPCAISRSSRRMRSFAACMPAASGSASDCSSASRRSRRWPSDCRLPSRCAPFCCSSSSRFSACSCRLRASLSCSCASR